MRHINCYFLIFQADQAIFPSFVLIPHHKHDIIVKSVTIVAESLT